MEIGLITAGVLIALSFDSIASWRRDRALLREARQNLLSEMRDDHAPDRDPSGGDAPVFADPSQANARDVEDLRRDIQLAAAALPVEEQVGGSLLKAYDETMPRN